jgi:hypothetical protein
MVKRNCAYPAGEIAMTTNPLNIVVFQEEGAWVAHCVEFDICAQAHDLKTLQRRIDLTIKLELQESIRRNGAPFAGIGPAPEYIKQRWEESRRGFTSSGTAHTENGEQTTVDYEMALCA